MTGKKTGKGKKGKVVGQDKPTKVAASNSGRKKSVKPVPQAPRRKKRQAPQITVESYNKLQDAYFIRQSVSYAAKEAGVNPKTAKIYIEGPGKPEVGLVPIKQVWLDYHTEAQEKKQITLARFQEEQLKEMQEILGTTLGELKLVRAEVVRRLNAYKASGGKEIETGATMSSALRSYEKAYKLMERMLGRADLTVEAQGETRYQNWTDEEMVTYMETGLVPAHAR